MEKIRKADIVLIAACMLAAALVGVFMMVFRHEGNAVRISCDGEILAEIAFKTTTAQRYFIAAKEGHMTVESCGENPALPDEEAYNLLLITNGMVRMEAADCRDQICVRHRAVSAEGESIICLPHKLVVEITDGAEYGLPMELEHSSPIETKHGRLVETEYDCSEETLEEELDGVVE